MPFTIDQFFNVFSQYNLAVWPMQIIFYLLGLTALAAALWQFRFSNRLVAIILTFFWIWMGAVYHLTYFTSINKAAYVFGSIFILQGILFFINGVVQRKLSFRPRLNVYAIVGGFFMLYGMVLYPVLGYFLGHVFPYAPTFGVPCPTVIFTFGLLLWTDNKLSKYLLIIPILWSVIGFSAAFQWGVLEDIMLLVTGVITTIMIFYRDKTVKKLSPSFSA